MSHDAADGRIHRDMVLGHAAALGGLDLIGRETEQPEFVSRRHERQFGRRSHDVARGATVIDGQPRLTKLLEGCQQQRAVDLGEVIALADRDADIVDEEPVEPAREIRGDPRNARVVVGDLAVESDFGGREEPADTCRVEPGELDRRLGQHDLPLIPFSAMAPHDRDEVHETDRTLGVRIRQTYLWVHRARIHPRTGRLAPGGSGGGLLARLSRTTAARPEPESKRGDDQEQDYEGRGALPNPPHRECAKCHQALHGSFSWGSALSRGATLVPTRRSIWA